MDKTGTAPDNSNEIESPTTPINPSAPSLKRVLYIEDELFISELYARALRRAGYEVTVVVDGNEGLAKARTNQFDIILLDIMLPNMTGTEMLKQLRADGQNITAKIIIATNLEQKEEVRAEIEKHADGYIVKANVTPKQLVVFLHSLEPKHP